MTRQRGTGFRRSTARRSARREIESFVGGLSVAGSRSSGASGQLASRVAIAGVIGIAVLSILALRLWGMTVLSGERYAELAVDNQVRRVPVEAPRGAILDRNGVPIVVNRPARELVLDVQDVPPARMDRLITDLSALSGVSAERIRQRIDAAGANPIAPVVIDREVEDESVIYFLAERGSRYPGVRVRDRHERNYVAGTLGAHMLGQVGEVSPEQLKGSRKTLRPGDRVGQSGLEHTYDRYLRGVDGYAAVEVDAAGIRHGIGRGEPARPGNDVRLSVDLGLQRATERALREGIGMARASRDGRNAAAGAAIAIDPRSGEILSMASYPTYNPDLFVRSDNDAEVKRVLTDRRTPLSNRAIAGLYPPGSTFKVVTGLAAMQEGFMQPGTMIGCPASMKIAGTKFNNWFKEPLPAMNYAKALEVSCDTYFYSLALDFYNRPGSPLQDWSRKFGLGQRAGIDIPGEEEGLIPTPAWRKRTFEGWGSVWSPGHSVNLSIGQGDLLVTPLQMAVIYSVVANGGWIVKPHLGVAVQEPSGREVNRLASARPVRKLPLTDAQIRATRLGLLQAANAPDGTSSAVFSSFEIPVAGKTGTAEKPPHGDMAWYCGYAPASAPTIVACTIIEGGGHGGSTAAPVVLKMFQHHFKTNTGDAAVSGSGEKLMRRIAGLDAALVLSTAGILAMSLFILLNSSAGGQGGIPVSIGIRQLIFALVSILVAIPILRIDLDRVSTRWAWAYGGAVLFIFSVGILGSAIRGSRRWIELGPVNLQPSEFGKVLVIFGLAGLVAVRATDVRRSRGLVTVLGAAAIPALLVFLQPDFGTAQVYAWIAVSVVYFAGARWTHLAAIASVVVVCALMVLAVLPAIGLEVLHDYQKQRLTGFIDPESDPQGSNYHAIQAKIAIGSGQLAGRDPKEATQVTQSFLPEPHTDFIFATIGERLGFIGGAVLILLFFVLLSRCLRAVTVAPTLFQRLLAAGVLALLGSQVLINMGMNLGIMPITGVPLPFVSYGGSAMVTNAIAVALVANVLRSAESAPVRYARRASPSAVSALRHVHSTGRAYD